ncbi:MAG: ISL3 family transposase [Oscillospiraceae bacterium]|nr:ISL3 family transposase [Oscillospiraceae bacterium]
MSGMKMLEIGKFYPKKLPIVKIREIDRQLIIEMESRSRMVKCDKCGHEMMKRHGTYIRTVQDLPILGKNVELKIKSYEYYCSESECGKKVFSETYDGFLSKYRRMTTRCEELVRMLGMETSSEGAARICETMGIKTSGDTIIRMIREYAEEEGAPECGETIGVDDFAYKKGQRYCTVVCDEESGRAVAVLEGRDGEKLKEWLGQNKQVKKITRDRAGAYAAAITAVIPEAMQIADRFHLHQNLMEAVKEAIKSVIPNEIEIPNTQVELVSQVNCDVENNMKNKPYMGDAKETINEDKEITTNEKKRKMEKEANQNNEDMKV